MTFGVSGTALAGIAIGGATLVNGYMQYQQGEKQANAAQSAANIQSQSYALGIAEQQREFDLVQKLLSPYVSAGENGLQQQQALLGLLGPDAYKSAIGQIQNGPEYQSLIKSGENAILSNASATGNLRGGNTQATLAQFRPSVLSKLINDQFNRAGGIAAIGENAATGTGTAAQNAGVNIANLYGQQGAAQAGAQIAAGQVPNPLASIPGARSSRVAS